MEEQEQTTSSMASDVALAVVQEVSELPDRTSPNDWPEAMLVTANELVAIVRGQIEAASNDDLDETHDRCVDGELPLDIDAELIRCATSNGRIAVNYLRDLWLRGSDYGYRLGHADGLSAIHQEMEQLIQKVQEIEQEMVFYSHPKWRALDPETIHGDIMDWQQRLSALLRSGK